MCRRGLDGFKMFASISIKMYNFMTWIQNEVLKMLFVVSLYRNKTIFFFVLLQAASFILTVTILFCSQLSFFIQIHKVYNTDNTFLKCLAISDKKTEHLKKYYFIIHSIKYFKAVFFSELCSSVGLKLFC